MRRLGRKQMIRAINRTLLAPMDLEIVDTARRRANAAVDAYDLEGEARAHFSKVLAHTMVSHARLITLYQQVRYLDENDIAGALVETGVWRGGAAAMMALAHMDGGEPSRKVHLFDSFEGMPEATTDDGERDRASLGIRTGDVIRASGHNRATEEEVRALLASIGYPAELTVIHRGWFQDTVPVFRAGAAEPIALLRLDGDLYDSTRVCLESLWPLVVPNGVVVIDDYRAHAGCRKAVDEYLAALHVRPYLSHIQKGGGRYLIKPATDERP